MRHYQRFVLAFLCFLPFSKAFGIDFDSVPLRQLEGKKIAFFSGSFDPFHKGHEAVVEALKSHVDFILLYVNGGQSSRKPNRLPKKYRQKMVENLYLEDPLVLVTNRDGYTLQVLLSTLEKTIFLAAAGADVILEMEDYPEVDKIYHRGTKLLSHEGHTAKAGMYIINAERFLAFDREGQMLPKKLFDRDIIRVDFKTPDISATQIRKALQKGASISSMVSEPVEKIIRDNGLYLKRAQNT